MSIDAIKEWIKETYQLHVFRRRARIASKMAVKISLELGDVPIDLVDASTTLIRAARCFDNNVKKILADRWFRKQRKYAEKHGLGSFL